MDSAILVLNAGSSSIKFSVFGYSGKMLDPLLHGRIESLFTAPRFTAKDGTGDAVGIQTWPVGTQLGHEGALEFLIHFLRENRGGCDLRAVGHRVVHGGMDYVEPVRVDRTVLAALQNLVSLAPLHQPHNLAPMRLLLERSPELPQIACFDTAFHRTQGDVAQAFALPAEITDAGVRRYGFHGISYEYIADVLPSFDTRAAAGRTIVLHLGNGASMCAMNNGRSVATTMGFTALDGLPMGTRCGALDPGVILYLMKARGMEVGEVERLLYQQSGLAGVSGISSDMRTLLDSDDPRAKHAIDLFVYRIGRELGSLAAALGGLDAIVFTAGIGEKAATIRERVCLDAKWLGLALDADANASHGPRISIPTSRVAAWVIPTNEEMMIARHTADAIA